MDDLAGVRTEFPNLPSGTRAISLPDNSYNNASPFLKVFGRPENESVCECERIQSSSLGQSLFLMNANDIKSKLGNSTGRAERLATSDQPFESLVSEIYRIAFARTPTASELSTSVAYVSAPKLDNQGNAIDAVRARRENFQDLLWALMNTKEFLFNH